jgi:AcrR family transcriptional regulator
MRSSTQTRRQRRPEARPEEILAAAYDVFARAGFTAARLEDVAAQAGVSKGTVYLYFESKDALFRAMVHERTGRYIAQLQEAVADGTPRERLERFVARMWAIVSEPQAAGIAKLVQGELHNFPELARFYYENVILRVRGVLHEVLAQGIAAGDFRAEQAEFAARAIPSLLVTCSKMVHLFGPHDPDPLTLDDAGRGALDLVLHGILAPAPSAPRP